MNAIYEWFLTKFLKSSKFWLAVAGVIATFLADKFNLDKAEILGILTMIVVLILGKGIEDAGKQANPNKLPENTTN